MNPHLEAVTGVLSGVIAAVLLGAFIGLWVWAYSGRRRPAFDAAARLPLEEDVYRAEAGGAGWAAGERWQSEKRP